MAKYNLLEEDDIFKDDDDIFKKEDEEKAQEPEKVEEPAQQVEEAETSEDELDVHLDDDELHAEDDTFDSEEEDLLAGDDDFDDDLFEGEVEEEESFSEELDQFESSAASSGLAEVEPKADEPAAREDSPVEIGDPEDDKQETPNYKPIIITAVAIVVLVGAYFAIDYFFLGGTEPSAQQTEAVSTEGQQASAEKQQRQQEMERKMQLLGELNSEARGKSASVGSVLSSLAASNNTRLSILHIYGDEFMFEIFGNDRADLARYNMDVKEKFSQLEVVSSSNRPGGGVSSVFKAGLAPGGSASSAGSENTEPRFTAIGEAEEWLRSTAKSAGLNRTGLNNTYLEREQNMQKFHVNGEFHGSLSACNAFISKVSKEGLHFNVYKLSIGSTGRDTYKLSFIFEVLV